MHFIVSTNTDKVNPATRKLIRSHVMQGKKLKKRAIRVDDRAPTYLNRAFRKETLSTELEEVLRSYTPLVPARVGSDISFIKFPDEIQLSMILKIIRTPIAKRIIFPLLAASSFLLNNDESLYPITEDAAVLHITAFTIEGFANRILYQEKSINEAAMLHLEKALKILRERLAGTDEDLKFSDLTISVVLKLASVAHFDEDHQTAKQHMQGLRLMIARRGGIGAFNRHSLIIEMLRCDLSIALLNGSDPVFYDADSEPLPEYPLKLVLDIDEDMSSHDNIPMMNMDQDLATAWRVMRRFCFIVNLGMQTRRFVHPNIIQETMTAVMYRLLHMRFSTSSLDESLRLGLLTFCCHVFLQWHDIKTPHRDFAVKFRQCVEELVCVDDKYDEMMLWLLMVGSISLLEMDQDAWLFASLRRCVKRGGAQTWKETQEVLKSFMWIPVLDDQPGKRIFGSLRLNEETTDVSRKDPNYHL